MKLKYYMICLLAAIFSSACAQAFQDNYEWIEPEQLYEITNFPSSGFFNEIHSIGVNEADDTLCVLHDTPAVLSRYHLATGKAVDQIRITRRVEAPAEVIPFDGAIFIIAERKLNTLTQAGALRSPWKQQLGKRQIDVDLGAAYFDHTLWLVDKKENLIFAMNSATRKLEQVYPATKNGKRKEPGLNIVDVATTFPNVLLVLDSRVGMVYKFMPGGKISGLLSIKEAFTSAENPEIVSIASDGNNNIWTINRADKTLDVFDSFGELTARVRDTGEFGFRFLSPADIEIDEDGRLFVVDEGSRSIKVYDISENTRF